MADPATLCPHCDRTTRAIRGICPNCGYAKDGAGPITEERTDIWRSPWDDLGDAFWLALCFAPGVVLLVVSLFVVSSTVLLGVAVVALIAPLAVWD
jgi:hypothetical protein